MIEIETKATKAANIYHREYGGDLGIPDAELRFTASCGGALDLTFFVCSDSLETAASLVLPAASPLLYIACFSSMWKLRAHISLWVKKYTA